MIAGDFMPAMFMRVVADVTTDTQEVKQGYGSLIFTGCFFLALIVVFIWWLRR